LYKDGLLDREYKKPLMLADWSEAKATAGLPSWDDIPQQSLALFFLNAGAMRGPGS
jgi:hypothetical protein